MVQADNSGDEMLGPYNIAVTDDMNAISDSDECGSGGFMDPNDNSNYMSGGKNKLG